MALFTDDDQVEGEWGGIPQPPRRPLRVRVGWVLLVAAFIVALILALAPAPYVVEQPGPVYNTLGSVEHDGTKTPLISIPDKKTYPTSGHLDLLTVSAVGNPDQLPSWFQVVTAWFDPSKAVVPVDVLYPPSVSVEQVTEADRAQMVNSQQDAVAAALNQLGYDFPQHVEVKQVLDGDPAAGKLKKGDQVVSVNGKPVDGIQSLRDAVAENGTGRAARIGVIRDGHDTTVRVTPVKQQGSVILGIGVGMEYTFPFTVKISLDDVGGPSAGMMFALGIIDTLTPGQLNGGKRVAGTGTIDSEGNVGEIGGIRQKMYAAAGAGDRYFLAPKGNCDQVTGHIPGKLHVFAVTTLSQSLTALNTIRSGGDTSALPTCPAS